MAQFTIQQAFDLALQHHHAGRIQEAEPIYRQILAVQPNHATSIHHLGLIALQVGKKLVAVNLIRRSIVLDPHCAEAYNNLANALVDLDQPEEAVASYRKAIELKSDFAAAYNNLGAALKDRGELVESITTYRKALQLRPDFYEAHYNLGDALMATGQLDQAIESYRQSVTIRPDYAEAHNNLGHALYRVGRLKEAVESARRALQSRPEFPEALCNLGIALAEQGHLDEAMTSYQLALAQRPDYAEAYVNIGSVMLRRDQIDEAVTAFDRALFIRPTFAEAHSNLGNAFAKKGERAMATAAYQKAALLKPDFFEAHYNLANMLREQDQFAEALISARRAVELSPAHPNARNNLGNILKNNGQVDEAISAYKSAVKLSPDYAEAHNGLGNVLKDTGQIEAAIIEYRKAVSLDPQSSDFHSNLILAMQYDPSASGDQIAAEEANWNHLHAEPSRTIIQRYPNTRDPHRRLRIGYVSPDFQRHAVGQNILPLFQHHDHAQFEITCYFNSTKSDSMTSQFQQLADNWVDIYNLSDEQVAEQIRSDQIDILVDLALHTAHHRLQVFGIKPAPVQATFAGYPGSTGLTTIDYRLCDPYLDPPGMDESRYSEKTIRLPDSFWCFSPLENWALTVDPLPAVENRYITFGSLGNFCKVNQEVLSLWIKVLQRVPRSRLMLLSPHGQHRLTVLDRFTADGIDPDRIEFIPRQTRRAYLQLYQRIDICLDTFPYNGHTTSLDSLWMGVPVVTLVGQRAIARAGWCQLSNLGLTELAAHSPDQFVQIAVDLTGDLPKLSELRSTLRSRMEKSPLMDAPKFAKSIESAYRSMWLNWIGSGKD